MKRILTLLIALTFAFSTIYNKVQSRPLNGAAYRQQVKKHATQDKHFKNTKMASTKNQQSKINPASTASEPTSNDLHFKADANNDKRHKVRDATTPKKKS